MIDYFIFINVIKASDNEAKNTLFGKYANDEPYFYGVWDLDGVIGTYWNGNKDPTTTEILVNNLFLRLLDTNPQNFKLSLALRWKTLRQGLLSTDSFKSRFFELHHYLLLQGVYTRELLVMETDEEHNSWNPDILNFGQDQLDYINNWIDSRFSYLDNYFNYMYETALPVKLESFNLNNSENRVKVEWSIAESFNVNSFSVERSLSGKGEWTTLCNIAYAEGKSSYYLFDDYPIPGIGYYRLKTTDFDGSHEYSVIKSIATSTVIQGSSGSVYPNPAKGILKYKPENIRRKISSVSILNALGITVFNRIDNPEQSIDISNIPPGIYITVVSFEDGGREHHKVAITN